MVSMAHDEEDSWRVPTIGAVSRILEKYDGSQHVENWFQKFDLYCRMNHINDEAKSNILLLSISDAVYDRIVSSGLSVDSEYHKLRCFVTDRYGGAETSFALQSEFMTLRQQVDEDVRGFGDRIWSTGVKAFRGSPKDLLNRTLVNQFVHGLEADEIRNMLLASTMDDFDKALDAAKRLELTIR